MARIQKKLVANIEGKYFVDSSCINCDTCREISPNVFFEREGYSVVLKQPENPQEDLHSSMAIIACPTGSIGTVEDLDRKSLAENFPYRIDEDVYYCGYNSPKSFGAKSYFVFSKDDNWLIDSPRYSKTLIEKIEELGGVDYIFLTHRDDVAEAKKFSEIFNAERIIHFWDRSAQRDAEIKIKGEDPIEFNEDVTLIPSPGHTRGSMVALFSNKYLFTGDHLYWRSDWGSLRASRSYNWWRWDEQVKSMKKLLDFDFEWILPGHGHRVNFPLDVMKQKMKEFIKSIEKEDYW